MESEPAGSQAATAAGSMLLGYMLTGEGERKVSWLAIRELPCILRLLKAAEVEAKHLHKVKLVMS